MATQIEYTSDIAQIEAQARKRVGELKDFYIHTITFVVINIFLVLLNLFVTPDYLWAVFPILGWGIGLAAHAVSVFGLFGIGTSAWEDRKVKEFMLAHQKGLSAGQVRDLLREELDVAASADVSDLRRVVDRLENLEAIVTSEAWDEREAGEPKISLEEPRYGSGERPELTDEERARQLSQRVR